MPLEIVLKEVIINVQKLPDNQPMDKVVIFNDPQSGIAVVVPMPLEICKQLATLLNGSGLVVPNGPLPKDLRH